MGLSRWAIRVILDPTPNVVLLRKDNRIEQLAGFFNGLKIKE
jgi:hypothetical protein